MSRSDTLDLGSVRVRRGRLAIITQPQDFKQPSRSYQVLEFKKYESEVVTYGIRSIKNFMKILKDHAYRPTSFEKTLSKDDDAITYREN